MPVDTREAREASNRFVASLAGALDDKDKCKGAFVSPLSIHIALAMVLLGAKGATAVEGWTALKFAGRADPDTIKSIRALVDGLLEASTRAPGPVLYIANRIYTRAALVPAFRRKVERVFNATIEPLTGAGPINAFVEQATKGEITQIVDSVSGASLIAVNALYFKGQWATKFEVKDTRRAPFYTEAKESSACALMRSPRGKKWRYHESKTAQVGLSRQVGQ